MNGVACWRTPAILSCANEIMAGSTKKTKASAKSKSAGSTDWHRLFVDQAQEGMVVFDDELRIRVWNAAMVRMTGLAEDDCIGESAAEVFAAAGVAEAEDSMAKALRGESDTLVPLAFHTDDDQQAQSYEASYYPIAGGAEGTMAGMVVIRDVTRRPGLEELTESERKHRLRFMHAADAILVIDRNGRYIDANPAASKLLGYSRDEFLNLSVPALSLPAERAGARKRFGKLLGTGVSRRERVIQRKDGTHVHVEAHAMHLGDGTIQTTVRDITERKEAEEHLHQVLQRLRFHIERMPLAYIVWTTDMRVAEWNPACERIFGWTAEKANGKNWMELVPESAEPQVRRVVSELLAGDTSSQWVSDNIRADGSIITCEWFNTPLRDSGGDIIGLASMVQDVTEREAAEVQLRQAQKLESLGTLTRGIAHDFGNLLMVVMGNLALLQNRPDVSEAAREHLSLIEEAATKASDLTAHLLAFARTGRHNPERADLNNLVTESLKLVRASLAPNVRVTVDLDEEIPEFRVDRSQVEQVLLNLCLNAGQAMADGGTITIQTHHKQLTSKELRRCVPQENRRPGPRIALVVRDTGHGMDETTISRMFDPFFSTRIEGHGLGMAAVLGILKQHEAHIVTDSAPGKGTTFTIYFPIHLTRAATDPFELSLRGKPKPKKPSRATSADRRGVI